jgi:hypothetical protein
METRCPRSWEIEAARDGRLGAEAQALLALHVARCTSCALEAQALESLAGRLRTISEVPADDVSVRRLKWRVLHAIDRDRSGASASARGRWLALGGAACLGVFSVVGAVRFRGASGGSDPTLEVAAEPGARWGTRTEGDMKRIDLETGTLRIRIARHPGDRMVVVGLPDGEIDDIGTTFSVTVAGDRTRRVGVEQGRVVLRLRGRADEELATGESWSLPASAEGDRIAVAPSLEVPEVAPEIRREAPAPGPSTKRSPRPAATARAAPSVAVDAGNGEDLAYLHVLKLLRAGDVASARAAAGDYMREFPAGFRAPELRRLLEEWAPSATGAAPSPASP